MEILPLAGRAGSGNPGGASKHWSRGCQKISSEKVSGNGLFQKWLWLLSGFATTVIRSE